MHTPMYLYILAVSERFGKLIFKFESVFYRLLFFNRCIDLYFAAILTASTQRTGPVTLCLLACLALAVES